jgi:hypothetical protein
MQPTDFEKTTALGALSFKIDRKPVTPNLSTYFDYDFYKYTIELMSMIIKRAFIANPVWTYECLWSYIKTNKAANINIELHPIYRELFNYVLSRMLFVKSVNVSNVSMDLFDIANVRINRFHIGGNTFACVEKAITQIGNYFVLCPIDEYGNLELYQYSFLKKKKLESSRTYQIQLTEEDADLSVTVDAFLKRNLNKYLFLLALTDKEHYVAMADYIELKTVLTSELFGVYKALKIAGDDWYYDKRSLNRFENNKWERYPKDSFAKIKENDTIIGFIEKRIFKTREPNVVEHKDRRKNLRGSSCMMKKRSEVERCFEGFGMPTKAELSVPQMCNRLFVKMIELEIQSRSSKDGVKYMYTFEEDYV